MAKYRVKSPTGETFEITAPDGVSQEEVLAYARQQFASQAPGAKPAPAPQAAPAAPEIDFNGDRETVRKAIAAQPAEKRPQLLREWARVTVAKERAGGGLGQWIDDRVRTLARGTPVGSWADEANALLASGAHKLTSGAVGAPYDEAKAYEVAKDTARDKDTTVLGTLPVIGDVTGAGLEKLAGGLISVPAAPAVSVARGASFLPQAANAGVNGMIYGGVYGAGEGEGLDRLVNGMTGTAIGGVLGPAGLAAGRGIGNAYQWAANKLAPKPGPLQGVHPAAVQKMGQMAEDDALAASYPRQAAELGPEGMLADMGSNMRMGAARIARNPGEGRTTVLDALNTRKEGAPGRITQDVDAALGQPVNVPETVQRIRQDANRLAQPHYDQFYQTPVARSPAIDQVLQRAEAGGLMAHVNRRLGLQGFDPAAPENLPRVLDQIKRAADDLASAAQREGQHEAFMLYTQLSRDVRRVADAATGGGAYSRARDISGEGLQFEAAVRDGQGAFSRSLSPDQMRYDIGQIRSPAARAAYGVAARDQVRQIMGNAATAYGPNGDSAARRALGAENAREKLALIAGPGGADRITRRLDAETAFERTRDFADRNSLTSTMQAAEKLFPGDAVGDVANKIGAKSISGMAMEGAYRIANILSGDALNERRLRIAADAAQLLVAQGARRDEIARALFQYASQNRLTGARRVAIERLARTLTDAARQPAIGAATGE